MNQEIRVSEGEFVIVPRGVEHQPVAHDEVSVLLFEPTTTVNTGTALPHPARWLPGGAPSWTKEQAAHWAE